jgi:hypothetical protein
MRGHSYNKAFYSKIESYQTTKMNPIERPTNEKREIQAHYSKIIHQKITKARNFHRSNLNKLAEPKTNDCACEGSSKVHTVHGDKECVVYSRYAQGFMKTLEIGISRRSYKRGSCGKTSAYKLVTIEGSSSFYQIPILSPDWFRHPHVLDIKEAYKQLRITQKRKYTQVLAKCDKLADLYSTILEYL